jgi:phosphoribosylglycinamide formyltransferase-1
MNQSNKKIAIFASGSGSNAEQITNHFHSQAQKKIEIVLILTNKSDAFVLERAEKLNVPSIVFSREDFYKSDRIVTILTEHQVDLVVLAGFLWLVPANLLTAFPNRIINIHPALLPKYGGKGMYGEKVHQAVVKNKETETGITIHLVDEIYDNGTVLKQAKCGVASEDSPQDVAEKIHQLEYDYFPITIEKYLMEIC